MTSSCVLQSLPTSPVSKSWCMASKEHHSSYWPSPTDATWPTAISFRWCRSHGALSCPLMGLRMQLMIRTTQPFLLLLMMLMLAKLINSLSDGSLPMPWRTSLRKALPSTQLHTASVLVVELGHFCLPPCAFLRLFVVRCAMAATVGGVSPRSILLGGRLLCLPSLPSS